MEKQKNPWVSFDKLTKFEQYMLTKDGIDIESIKDIRLISTILNSYQIYVLIDLVTDIHFTLYKGYLYNIYGEVFSDNDVYGMASPAISKKLKYKDNLLIPNNLSVEYEYRLLHDKALINALKEKGLSFDLKELKMLFPNFKSLLYLCSEKTCIDNINLRKSLHEIGLEEYSKKIITRLLGEEAYLTLGKEGIHEYNDTIKSENLGISFNISRKKKSIKKLIKEYKKSTM